MGKNVYIDNLKNGKTQLKKTSQKWTITYWFLKHINRVK